MSEKSGIQRDDQHPAAEPPDGGPRILGLDQSSGGGAGKDATKEPGSEGARGETQAAAEQHPLVAQYQRDLEAANATKVERGVAAAQATSEGEIAIIVEGASAKKAEIDADISLGSGEAEAKKAEVDEQTQIGITKAVEKEIASTAEAAQGRPDMSSILKVGVGAYEGVVEAKPEIIQGATERAQEHLRTAQAALETALKNQEIAQEAVREGQPNANEIKGFDDDVKRAKERVEQAEQEVREASTEGNRKAGEAFRETVVGLYAGLMDPGFPRPEFPLNHAD